jgi:hypothetical protein
MAVDEKQQIEQQIERARDGVGDRIDEIDRRLRTTFDVRTLAREHAPQLIAGGAVLGFLVGFGLPKALKKLIGIGIPVALIAYKVKQARDSNGGHATSSL